MLEKYKISDYKKKKLLAGSNKNQSNNFWNNSIGFGIIGSTILSIVQFIFTIITTFIKSDDSNSKTSNYNPNYSRSKVNYRLSKYPSKTNVFV